MNFPHLLSCKNLAGMAIADHFVMLRSEMCCLGRLDTAIGSAGLAKIIDIHMVEAKWRKDSSLRSALTL